MKSYTLDARRLLCPLPVIKTQNKIQDLVSGDELVVVCTDPGALQDIPTWCRMYGHEVIHTEQNNNEISIAIRVGAGEE